ncbi:MAG: hypothetical protein R3F35_15250 [Myxococcota bacterium]
MVFSAIEWQDTSHGLVRVIDGAWRRAVPALTGVASFLLAGPAWATDPCPTPTHPPCNAVITSVLARVDHSDVRPGYTAGEYIVGGEFGSGIEDLTENGNRFSLGFQIRSTEYAESRAEAGTLDLSMLARVETESDLASGTMRARIEGGDTTLFPASLFEVSQARADLSLRETVTFHLPANYAGGTARVFLTVEGTIGDDRPMGVFASSEVYAQLLVGSGPNSLAFRRWNATGGVSDVLIVDYALFPTGSNPIDQAMGIEALLRLNSGDGDGSYGIDFMSELDGAQLSLMPPDGLTWDSASGVFLTVPEPTIGVMPWIGPGLLCLATRRRARR